MLKHVTEVHSNIQEIIRFRMMLKGKSVNTGALRMKDLSRDGMINVDVHKLKESLRLMPELEIHALVNKKLKFILNPFYLITCVRVTFYYSYSGGNLFLTANGLKEQKDDVWWRIRCLVQMRNKEYTKREGNPTLVLVNIGKAVDHVDETKETRASGPVAAHASSTFEEINVPSRTIELNDEGLDLDLGLLTSSARSSGSDSSSNLSEQSDDRELFRRRTSDLKYQESSNVEGQSGKVSKISNSDIRGRPEPERHFGNTLIGYIGEEPGSSEINFINGMEEFRHCQIIVIGAGFFAFRFSNLEQRNEILEKDQLFIDKIPLILKRWSRDLVNERSRFLSTVPIWVKFYNINFANWTEEYLAEVSSDIGDFLYMDNCTAEWTHLEFARVCVEVDPFKELPDKVRKAVGNGGDDQTIPIEVSYEWKPKICRHCTSLCHDSKSCQLASEEVHLQREDSYVSIEELRSPEIAVDEGEGNDTVSFGLSDIMTTLSVQEIFGRDGELGPERPSDAPKNCRV